MKLKVVLLTHYELTPQQVERLKAKPDSVAMIKQLTGHEFTDIEILVESPDQRSPHEKTVH